MHRSRAACALLVAVATACDSGAGGAADAAPAVDAMISRAITGQLTTGAEGISDELSFEIPPYTRSVTVVAVGDASELYALARLELSDGVDRVNTDLPALPDAMRASYVDEEIGQAPGDLYQTVRLGTFTHVYPYAPGQSLPAGPARLQIASTATAGTVELTVLMPSDEPATQLPINVILVSDSVVLETPPAFVAQVQAILDPAGITLELGQQVVLADSPYASISDFSEPQEAPDSSSARLALAGAELVDGDGLNVFVVDSLPFGVGGLSLGTPGPPVADSYYFGVVVRYSPADLGRVVAHELCHFLALQHVTNRGISGTVYPDPLDDTSPGTGNLMESGTTLTDDQVFALSRSALLRQ